MGLHSVRWAGGICACLTSYATCCSPDKPLLPVAAAAPRAARKSCFVLSDGFNRFAIAISSFSFLRLLLLPCSAAPHDNLHAAGLAIRVVQNTLLYTHPSAVLRLVALRLVSLSTTLMLA